MNYFYHPNPELENQLSNEESFHCIKVLRKKQGDLLDIIDGKGSIYSCRLENESHRNAEYFILKKQTIARSKKFYAHIAIAPTKNQDRIEWFVEKACELGIDEISFVLTARTERKKINLDRIEKKAIGAMKQSKNLFKTIVNELNTFKDFVQDETVDSNKYIAFVDHENQTQLSQVIRKGSSNLVLIGPEGDFTTEEVKLAENHSYQKVALGKSVLRTETAGIIACHSINLIHEL